MKNAEVIIEFEGSISFDIMERLLHRLKSARQFNELRKPVRKRVYGTVVESIDNIFKYAVPEESVVVDMFFMTFHIARHLSAPSNWS